MLNCDEMIDLYDENKNLIGKTHPRRQSRSENNFGLVVHVLVRNSEGKFLITKRATGKNYYDGLWETTGGMVVAGENSLDGAIREVREETGFVLNRENAMLLFTEKRTNLPGWNCFMDNWYFKQDLNLKNFVPQSGETVQCRWATFDEILKMHENGEFVPFFETGLDIYFVKLGLMAKDDVNLLYLVE